MADHFKIVNPATLVVAASTLARAALACGIRADAPVCTNGNEDVTCTGETYRGCETGQTDCANNPGNDDDVCCWGVGPGSGDNIDHENCLQEDAEFGGMGWCWWEDYGNPPAY